MKGVKEISELGKLQNGSIPGWHKLKTTLPPCAHLTVYCCVHKPLKAVDNNDDDDVDNHDGDERAEEDSKGKHTHVVADCTCTFQVTVRDLVVISGKNKKKNELLQLNMRFVDELHEQKQIDEKPKINISISKAIIAFIFVPLIDSPLPNIEYARNVWVLIMLINYYCVMIVIWVIIHSVYLLH